MIRQTATQLILFLVTIWTVASARAELTIEITQGIDNPTRIAVVPFGYGGTEPLPEGLAEIVSADLLRSGQFSLIDQADLLSLPRPGDRVLHRDWRILGADYLVMGRVEDVESGYKVTYELHDILGQKLVAERMVSGEVAQLRDIAHLISDEVFENVTGIRGAFSTKIIYVEAFNNSRYRLMRADADGAREVELLRSTQPVLSPAWSPDGSQVAYVSFATGRPAIYRQELATGTREQLTDFRGLNGAPAWSPDGKQLALVLSKDGSPDIYTLDIATKKLTRVVSHFAIDTEPNWTIDGKGIIFTSNRGGKPQIYQVTLASGRVERLTFEGDYNARSRLSPDGKYLVMVHRPSRDGNFHIAAQEIDTGDIRILTETHLDESPSMAPNGAMLMYATRYKGKGILAAVSLDAGVKVRLPSQKGDVREPAWSPFFD